MSGSFAGWLRGLDEARLVRLLELRPDSCGPPAPESMEALAERLSSMQSVHRALGELSELALVVIKVVQGLGGSCSRAEIDEHLHLPSPADQAAVELAVAALVARGLLLDRDEALPRQGGGPDGLEGGLTLVKTVRALFPGPFGLGRPLRQLLGATSPSWLAQMRTTYRLPEAGRGETHTALVALLTRRRILDEVRHGPPRLTELLHDVMADGGIVVLEGSGTFSLDVSQRTAGTDDRLTYAVDHALLVPVDWQVLELPNEVALALRSPGWALSAPTSPPEPPTAATDHATVERESGASGAAAVIVVTDLLELLSATPARELKTGGVGIREVRRLAKALGRSEADVAMALQLVIAARLVGVTGLEVVPRAEYDEWRMRTPAERLASLLSAWWSRPGWVSGELDDDDKPLPPVSPRRADERVLALRQAMVGVLAALPAGRGAVDAAGAAATVAWSRPLGFPQGQQLTAAAQATWWEGHWLGALAHGRASAVGAALTSYDEDRLLQACQVLVPEAISQAMFQADLTAVVAGSPSSEVASLLDSCADREASGGAVIWRFSPATVRRCLDTGQSAPALLRALGAIARDTLPQPLTYLVNDMARRHGRIAVRPLRCVLVSQDAALLAELAAHRALRPLALSVVAPTVLASAKSLDETVTLLRQAGYAPVRHTQTGELVVDRATPRRVKVTPRPTATTRAPRPGEAAPTEPVTPAALAKALREASRHPGTPAPGKARPAPPAPPRPASSAASTLARLAERAGHLSDDERSLLAHAIDFGGKVGIDYRDVHGSFSTRAISDVALDPPYLEAFCHLREDDRVFLLSGISAVYPA
ncbi:MAG TPA: helicase-associated domain-containing protein [Actinomycetes bacterium]|nr:helicase-associated domain-containing protein [Actinomycetes bacterium]